MSKEERRSEIDWSNFTTFDYYNFEIPHPEYRAIYIRDPIWSEVPKFTIWQRIKYFIRKLFTLKHDQSRLGPSRTVTYVYDKNTEINVVGNDRT